MFTKWKFLWWFVYEGTIGQRFGCGQWGGHLWGWSVRRDVGGHLQRARREGDGV